MTFGQILFLLFSSEKTIIIAEGYVVPQVECVSGRRVLWTLTDFLCPKGALETPLVPSARGGT